jgi:hypothetical protein
MILIRHHLRGTERNHEDPNHQCFDQDSEPRISEIQARSIASLRGLLGYFVIVEHCF